VLYTASFIVGIEPRSWIWGIIPIIKDVLLYLGIPSVTLIMFMLTFKAIKEKSGRGRLFIALVLPIIGGFVCH